jgi:hypothetical protein
MWPLQKKKKKKSLVQHALSSDDHVSSLLLPLSTAWMSAGWIIVIRGTLVVWQYPPLAQNLPKR